MLVVLVLVAFSASISAVSFAGTRVILVFVAIVAITLTALFIFRIGFSRKLCLLFQSIVSIKILGRVVVANEASIYRDGLALFDNDLMRSAHPTISAGTIRS